MKKTILFIASVTGSILLAQTYTGNVGINTTSPQKTLDVNGDFRTQKTDSSTNTVHMLETNSSVFPGYSFSRVADGGTGDGSFNLMSKDQNIMSIGQGTNTASVGMSSFAGSIPAVNIASSDVANGSVSLGVSSTAIGALLQNPTGSARTQFTLFNSTILGPYFSYTNNGTTTGEYSFPRNYGKRGQVLTTHGAPGDAGNGGQTNVLTWRDVADLIVLKAPNGSCYKLTVNNLGVLGTVADTDCAVDAYNPSLFGRMSSETSNLSEINSSSKIIDNQNKMISEQNKLIDLLKSRIKQVEGKEKSGK